MTLLRSALIGHVFCAAIFISGAAAAVWTVPDDAASIQAGIDMSAAGDTVLLSPGTYYTHNLLMKSGVTMFGADDPENVVIDAMLQGMIIDLTSTDGHTRLENITFKRGTNIEKVKGAVNCVNSNATFRNCIFRENQQTYEKDGAGLYSSDSSLTLIDCQFLDNITEGAGGGLCSRRSTTLLIGCEFRGNQAALGGGLYFTGSGHTSRMQKCAIEDNRSNQGGGLYCSSVELTIAGCEIRDNFAESAGGGVYLFLSASLEAHTSVFETNATAGSGKAAYGTSGNIMDFYCTTIDYYGIEGGVTPAFYFEGCRSLGNQDLSWGRVKTLYR